jgi:hypothetical protein
MGRPCSRVPGGAGIADGAAAIVAGRTQQFRAETDLSAVGTNRTVDPELDDDLD